MMELEIIMMELMVITKGYNDIIIMNENERKRL